MTTTTLLQPHDDLLFAKYQGFYERMTEGDSAGRTHANSQDWNEAYDEGMNEADALDEDRRAFSLPEIQAMFDEKTYLKIVDLLDKAAFLIGGDSGANAEYERGMAELILYTGGLPSNYYEQVIAAIYALSQKLRRGCVMLQLEQKAGATPAFSSACPTFSS